MDKSPDAFRTISEVADWLGTPAHVLRFWESKFAQVKPIKRAGGRRYYRPSDMALLGGLKKLLHEDGMSIKGAQALIREHGVRHVAAMSPPLDGETVEAETEVVEAEAAPAEERRRDISGLPPPLILQTGEFAQDDAPEEVPEVALGDEQGEGETDPDDEAQPSLPFLHRPYEERAPQARPDLGPMLRRAAEALDSRANPAPEVPEDLPLPEPDPLQVPRLNALRAAVAQGEPSDRALRSKVVARLVALRDRMSADRTG